MKGELGAQGVGQMRKALIILVVGMFAVSVVRSVSCGGGDEYGDDWDPRGLRALATQGYEVENLAEKEKELLGQFKGKTWKQIVAARGEPKRRRPFAGTQLLYEYKAIDEKSGKKIEWLIFSCGHSSERIGCYLVSFSDIDAWE